MTFNTRDFLPSAEKFHLRVVTAIAEKLAALKTVVYFPERAKCGNPDAALALLNRTGGGPPQAGDETL